MKRGLQPIDLLIENASKCFLGLCIEQLIFTISGNDGRYESDSQDINKLLFSASFQSN
jgi:hypothetical protein